MNMLEHLKQVYIGKACFSKTIAGTIVHISTHNSMVFVHVSVYPSLDGMPKYSKELYISMVTIVDCSTWVRIVKNRHHDL